MGFIGPSSRHTSVSIRDLGSEKRKGFTEKNLGGRGGGGGGVVQVFRAYIHGRKVIMMTGGKRAGMSRKDWPWELIDEER